MIAGQAAGGAASRSCPAAPGDRDRLALAAWSRLTEPGDRPAFRFVAARGPAQALAAVVDGRDPEVAPRWRLRLGQCRPERDLATLGRLGGRLLIPGDDDWPAVLDELGERRPFCLWVRGTLPLSACLVRSVAVVGARVSSGYGERVAADLAASLADRGVTVVSGAAYGIDASAHRGALSVGGPTIAVLACGVDRVYPRGNERLIERIAGEGCVMSEIPLGCSPTRTRFVLRNRLIASATRATVVVEAARRSGTSVTAREAIDLGRHVGAVPGPVTSPQSAGCHDLLRDGAVCITDALDVIELLSPSGEGLRRRPPVAAADHDGLAPDDVRVLDAVPVRTPAAPYSIAVTAGLDESTVQTGLARLEIRGLVVQARGHWMRTPRAPRRPAAASRPRR